VPLDVKRANAPFKAQFQGGGAKKDAGFRMWLTWSGWNQPVGRWWWWLTSTAVLRRYL